MRDFDISILDGFVPTRTDYTPKPQPKPESTMESISRNAGESFAPYGVGSGKLVRGVGTFLFGSDSGMAEVGANTAEYWQEAKSDKLKGQEQANAEIMADPNKSGWDIAGNIAMNPTLLGSMALDSAPTMAIGMGIGGLAAKAALKAGLMVNSAGELTAVGARTMAGVGEAVASAPAAWESTKGSGVGTATEFGLNVLTSIVTPGNATAAGVRKIVGGTEHAVEGVLTSTAPGRVFGALSGEGSQEGFQSFGQELIEQKARGEDLNMNSIYKQTAAGAVVGAAVGGALHPIVGEGAPIKSADQTKASAPPEVLAELSAKVADRQTALDAAPNNPVLQAELTAAQAELNHAVEPTDVGELRVRVAEANVTAARDPSNRELRDNADMLAASAALEVAGAEGVRIAADLAHGATQQAYAEAPDANATLAVFSAGEQASSILRTVTTSVENTEQGVNQGLSENAARALALQGSEANASLDEATDEIETPEQALRLENKRLQNEILQIRVAREAAKVREAETKAAQAEAPLPIIEPTPQVKEEISYPEVALPDFQETTTPDFTAGPSPIITQVDYPEINGDMVAQPEGAAVSRQVTDARDALLQAHVDNGLSGEQAIVEADYIGSLPQAELAGIVNDPVRFSEDERAYALARLTDTEAPATVTAPAEQARVETTPRSTEARQAMLDRGYLPEVVSNLEGYSLPQLRTEMNDLRVSPERRRYAHALLQQRGSDTMNDAQFDAREAELERGLSGHPADHRQRITGNMSSFDDRMLRQLANNPSTPSFALARAALAFRTGAHMGNVDTATAEPERRAPSNMSNVSATPTPAPSRSVSDLMREAAAELETEQTAVNPRVRTQEGMRAPEQNFAVRAQAAKDNGTLDKLGKFWKTLMSRPAQRTLPAIDMSDKQAQVRAAVAAGQPIPQSVLTTLMNRYNAALKSKARAWAAEHNQAFSDADWVNPITDIASNSSGRSAGFVLHLYGLGRGGANPYSIVRGSQPVHFSADSSIHAVQLRGAKGSGDLAYRIAAQVADLRGKGFPSDSTLLTVNSLRRQLQSMSSDTLFWPGVISPLAGGGYESPQGIPPAIWDASTADQKIGLNALRATHSITEARGQDAIRTAGKFAENLVFDRQGRIKAFTDPRVSNGFPRGTIVTDAMLQQKVAELDPATGIAPYQTDTAGHGGVGADTARLAILNNTILNEIEKNPEKKIPAWIGAIGRAEGRKIGGWFFSEAETNAEPQVRAPITHEAATARVKSMLGESVAKVLLDSGMINFVQTQGELTRATFSDSQGRIQGATSPGGKITMVLDNLTDANFDAVLQHEGLHATLNGLLGEDTYTRLLSQLDTLLQAGEGAQWVKDANARVPANTTPENRTEEIAAYAVELVAKGEPESNPLVRWAKKFMSALRAVIISNKSMPEALRTWAMSNLQAADLQNLALMGLRSRAVSVQEGTRFSEGLRSTAEYENEINALMAEHGADETTGPRRSEINTKVAKLRTAWRVAEEAEYSAGRRSEGASFGTPTEGSTSVQGVHFSNEQRDVLNTSAYGKGVKGAEARRLSEPENADIQQRTHFYVDEGNGVSKEEGVGAYGHMTQLNNLYNVGEDKLGIWKHNAGDTSAQERAVVDAGFDGYYAPGYDGKQGAAVVIGDHTIPTEPYTAGTNVSPATEKVSDTYADKLRKSNLPGGQMLGREWAVALKGGDFDTPAVRAALENHAGEMIYRDDLPRFNSGNRYSIAEEQEIKTAPVAPAPKNELDIFPTQFNVLANTQRGVGRYLEKGRAWFQDKDVAIKRIQTLAGITAENIKLSVSGALDRMGSTVMSLENELVDRPLAKLEGILHASGMAPDEAAGRFNDYVINRHVEEYNNSMAEINPAHYDGSKYIGGHDEDHPGSGIKTKVANAHVAKVVAQAKAGDLKARAILEAAEVHDKMIRDFQDYAVRQGLEKQSVVDMWRDKYKNYTPFNRDLETDENLSIGGGAGGQGLSLRAGISRGAMGSSKEIINPLYSLTQFGMKTIKRGEGAVVARALLNFAREFTPMFQHNGEMLPMWSIETVPNQRVTKRMNVYNVRLADGTLSPEFYNRQKAQAFANMKEAAWRALNPNATEPSRIAVEQLGTGPQNRVVVQPIPNHLSQDNVFSIPENGETKFMVFDVRSTDGMAALNAFKGTAMHGKTLRKLNTLLTPARMFSNWVVVTSTGLNPAFMPFNSIRDVTGAMISAHADKIPGWNMSDSNLLAKKFPRAMKEIWAQSKAEFVAKNSNGVTAPVPKAGSLAEWRNLCEENGGLVGISQSITDNESATTKIRRLFGQDALKRKISENVANDYVTKAHGILIKVGDSFHNFAEGQTDAKIMGAISRNLVSGVRRMNSAAEEATRTIAFKRATELYMEAGKTKEEAMKLAAVFSKNISTNFQRRGEVTSVINSLFPFFGAAIQGSSRLAEVMFEKQTYNVKRNGEVLLDQKTRLTKTGKVVLAALPVLGIIQSLALFAAGFEDDDIPQQTKDRALIIPLGDGAYFAWPMPHGFNTLMNFGREMTDAVRYPSRALEHIGNATFGQLGAFNPLGSAGNWMTDLAPAIADPFIQYTMNKDAFGRPIAKENVNSATPIPGFARAKEGASTTGRVISEAINSLTGGNQDQSGMMSPTPDQIDFVIGQFGGGVGRELGKVAGVVGAAKDIAMGNEREPIPTYKLPLIGRVICSTKEPVAITGKLYKIRTDLNENYARYKGLKDRGDIEAANAFWDEHPELALRNSVESFMRKGSKQKKARASARTDDKVSEVNRITNQEVARASDLVARYKEIKNQ